MLTLSSSLTSIFVLESDLPASQCGTASSLLWEQEISYKSWPLAPGCCPPCEKIRNDNSIITIINSLSTSRPALQQWMFSFQGGTVGQSDSRTVEHIPCKYQLTLLSIRMFISFSWAERHRNKSISWVDRLNVRWMSGGNKHITLRKYLERD